MSNIKIEGRGSSAVVLVDGVSLTCLTSISVGMRAGHVAEVQATMFLREADIAIEGAVFRISGCEMPEAVEEALLDHLCAKYPLQSMVKRSTGGLFDPPKTADELQRLKDRTALNGD